MTNTRTYAQMVADLAKAGDQIIAELTPMRTHLWHMVTGISGEVGELMSDYDDWIEDRVEEFDFKNMVKELGDIEFYIEGLRQPLGITRESILESISDHIAALPEVGEGLIPPSVCTIKMSIAAAKVLDRVKKIVIYNEPVADNLDDIVKFLGDLELALEAHRRGTGVSYEEVLSGNRIKLEKRYPGGSYSNADATARADVGGEK